MDTTVLFDKLVVKWGLKTSLRNRSSERNGGQCAGMGVVTGMGVSVQDWGSVCRNGIVTGMGAVCRVYSRHWSMDHE